LDYSYAGHSAEITQQLVDMAMNASGMRDTARVLPVSPTTVIKELKKNEPELQPVHQNVLASVHPEQVEVEIWRADELEVRRGLSSARDEMWSFVQAKAHPRWLWHAIDHHSGKGLAYVFGRRKDAVFLKLQQRLEPLGITQFSTDGWGAYERHLDAKKHHVGKEHTQNALIGFQGLT
jgi:IS1 family transposase